MEIFSYLTDKNKNSIFTKYSSLELSDKFVIRDEYTNKFIIFQSYEDYIAYWKKTPNEQKCFHEVIFGTNAQKIKFDLDILEPFLEELIPSKELIPPSKELIDEINTLIDIIISKFNHLYGIELTYEDIIVTSSSGVIKNIAKQLQYKYSYHIIVNNYLLNNNEEAIYFTSQVYEQISELENSKLQKYIDLGVNKKVQNFRLLGCTKKTSPLRFKKIVDGDTFHCKINNISYKDTIITLKEENYILLPNLSNTVATKNATTKNTTTKNATNKYINAAIEWLQKNNLINDHEVRCVNGNIISFNRIDNIEKCRICDRIHDNDNSLYIRVQPIRKNTVSIIEYCHRSKSDKYNTLNTSLNVPLDPIESPIESYLQKILNKILDSKDNNMQFENITTLEYCDNYMRPYPIDPETLCIKAPMGCGKTKALRDYLNIYFDDNKNAFPQVIRFLTFRQTFAKSLMRDFNDFTLYSDIVGDITNDHKRIIIQVESLHRLMIKKHIYGPPAERINLLILDEVESILGQFNSGLHRNFNAAFATFQWLISTAERVICIDANLSERTINILKRIRPNYEIHFHHNTFKKETENIYKLTNNNSNWLSLMFAYLSDNKKVVVPTNSITEGKIYKQLIEDSFPDKSVCLYSSEMLISEKNEHFSNVEKYWSQLDVLIYTPTCSAGISFEIDYFDVLFAHMSDASCDVETCRQMLMRVRNLKTKTYYIYFPPYSSNYGNYPTTTEDIEAQLHNKKLSLYKDIDQTNLQFEYTPDGDTIYFKSNYYYLWLENVRVENLSKNKFVELFIHYAVNSGARVEIIEHALAFETEAITKDYKNIKLNIKTITADSIVTAKDIDQEELKEIQDRRLLQQDVQIEEIRSCEKYYLKDVYKLKHDIIINKEFVLLYNHEDIKKVFKYLSKICAYETIEEALIDMQRRDIAAHSSIAAFSSSDNSSYNSSDNSSYNSSDNSSYNSSDNSSYNSSAITYRDGLEYNQLVKHKYSYIHHLSIQELIKICGFHFTNIFCNNDKFISAEAINNNLKQNMNLIEKYLLLIISEIKISKSFSDIKFIINKFKNEINAEIFIKKMIKLLNFGLRDFYGIEIKKNKNNEYSLLMWKTALMFEFINVNSNINANSKVNANATEEYYKPKILQNLNIL